MAETIEKNVYEQIAEFDNWLIFKNCKRSTCREWWKWSVIYWNPIIYQNLA